MRLTTLQLRALKRYWSFHRENYYSSSLILANGPLWLLCVVGAGLSYWVASRSEDYSAFGWWAIGFFCGCVVLTIKAIRTFSRVWPLIDQIVNWERVDQLLKENDPKHESPD